MVRVRYFHRSYHRCYDNSDEAAVQKYNENALTVEMIVEVTRRASQAHIRR